MTQFHLGYAGQLRSLQSFMRAYRPEPQSDPVVRFETAAGQQMQCDFVVFRRGADPLYAFTATLGFSRWRWTHYAANERAQTLVRRHHALFETLGGVPKEILYDNARTIVLERDAYGEGQHRWHPAPAALFEQVERAALQPLPHFRNKAVNVAPDAGPELSCWPQAMQTSLQHPLSIYQNLLTQVPA